MVAADEINRRYTNQLGNQTRELGQFASGFALVQEIAGEGDELGLLLPDFFDQLFVVLAEARAVQVAQLDYFEAVEARRQPIKAQLQPRDLQAVFREQHRSARERQQDEGGKPHDPPPLFHCASWSRM